MYEEKQRSRSAMNVSIGTSKTYEKYLQICHAGGDKEVVNNFPALCFTLMH